MSALFIARGENVNVKAQSPIWLQENYVVVVFVPIDPIVDITNYVLLELGPTNACF